MGFVVYLQYVQQITLMEVTQQDTYRMHRNIPSTVCEKCILKLHDIFILSKFTDIRQRQNCLIVTDKQSAHCIFLESTYNFKKVLST